MQFVVDFSKRLREDFFKQPTEWVARNIIGKVMVKQMNGLYAAAMIVEAEAYLSEFDSASHSSGGKTKRNEPMFEDGGKIYVYKIYGIHHCVNIVTEYPGKGCAVLIRAGEPLLGIDILKSMRGDVPFEKILAGPGNFAKAFSFTVKDNRKSIFTSELFIQEYLNFQDSEIGISERIGINRAKELPLRFYLRGSKFVSANPKT